jgi:hypothetical protein
MARVEVEVAVTHRYRATLDVPFAGALRPKLNEWPAAFERAVIDEFGMLDDLEKLTDPIDSRTLLVSGRVVEVPDSPDGGRR